MSAAAVFARLQATGLARLVGGSTSITGLLSGIHLVGMTMIAGGALVFTTRTLRYGKHPDAGTGRRTAEQRAITLGILVSLSTGALLVLPRLAVAFANPIFQIKMLLLCAALAVHLAFAGRASRAGLRPSVARVGALTALTLWYTVVLAGCAFILWE
jgi:hypothetical protein